MGSKLLAKACVKKALEEDPSIFEYDEVYDEIKKDEREAKTSEEPKKQSKYIQSLLKTAERRKREQERRIIRKAQREIEEDKDQYGETETFITSSYKEKLKEMRELEEKEKMEIALEEAMDVKKQKDLSGFYKYFLNNTLCTDNSKKKSSEGTSKDKSVPSSKKQMTEKPEKVPSQETVLPEALHTENAATSNLEDKQEATDEKNFENLEPKISKEEQLKKIFEKRTVGEVFNEAVQRFKQRQSLLSTG